MMPTLSGSAASRRAVVSSALILNSRCAIEFHAIDRSSGSLLESGASIGANMGAERMVCSAGSHRLASVW